MSKCNCLDDALKKITEKYPEWDGKKVLRYSYSDMLIDFRTGESMIDIGINIQYEKQKKLGRTSLSMAFCPLCGKSLKEEYDDNSKTN